DGYWLRLVAVCHLNWFADVVKDSVGAPVLNAEAADWKWASKRDIRQMISRGDFFAYSYFDNIPIGKARSCEALNRPFYAAAVGYSPRRPRHNPYCWQLSSIPAG